MIRKTRKSDTYEVSTSIWLNDLHRLREESTEVFQKISELVTEEIVKNIEDTALSNNYERIKKACENIDHVAFDFDNVQSATVELLHVVIGSDFPIQSAEPYLELQHSKKRIYQEIRDICRDLHKAASAKDKTSMEELTNKLSRTFSAFEKVKQKEEELTTKLINDLNKENERARRYGT